MVSPLKTHVFNGLLHQMMALHVKCTCSLTYVHGSFYDYNNVMTQDGYPHKMLRHNMKNVNSFDSNQAWEILTAYEACCLLRGNRKHNKTDKELHWVSADLIYFITSWILDSLLYCKVE